MQLTPRTLLEKYRNRMTEIDKVGIQVVDRQAVSGGHRYYLEAGFVMTIYDSGKVLVQGKIAAEVWLGTLSLLQRCLPTDTGWHVTLPDGRAFTKKGR